MNFSGECPKFKIRPSAAKLALIFIFNDSLFYFFGHFAQFIHHSGLNNPILSNRYPILSELAKAIFSTMPSSTPVESIFSGAKETANPLRSRAGPEQVRNLTMLRLNKF